MVTHKREDPKGIGITNLLKDLNLKVNFNITSNLFWKAYIHLRLGVFFLNQIGRLSTGDSLDMSTQDEWGICDVNTLVNLANNI